MKNYIEYLKFFSLGLACLLVIYFLPLGFVSKISSDISDLASWYTYSFSKGSLKQLKFVGIAIDDYSLSNIRQRWPFKRTLYAELLKILDKEKVHTVGIDILFEKESEDKEEDWIFSEALGNVSSRVVLPYRFDAKRKIPLLYHFNRDAFSMGMINTPQDITGKTYRLRSFVAAEGKDYYSFSVALASTYLNQSPQQIVSYIPQLENNTYAINYLLTPRDTINLSLFDVLENLQDLKQQYGDNFLKDSLVLVYPEAEVIHDIYMTPLGRMPGGFLHLNGVADIILRRFVGKPGVLHILFLIGSLLAIAYALLSWGFVSSFIISSGVLLLNFWCSVFFALRGINLDYSRIAIFCLLYFTAGSLYKYIYFLAQLIKIKDKATLDPLRNIFTLKYFYHRIRMEQQNFLYKKGFSHKDQFLFFIYLSSFKNATESLPLERIKNIWQMISSVISCEGSFWSVYSQEEITGYLVARPKGIQRAALSLKNNLGAILKEAGIELDVKLAYLKMKKEFPVRELLFFLSKELKEKNEGILYFKDSDLTDFSAPPYVKLKETGSFLEGLEEDIEEKNRQLLSLVDDLNKGYTRTKEAFFQIITSLVNALEARDPYTQGHSERVCSYALRMAERLGWNQEEKEKLKKAALLHDIGKIGIHDNILHKPGKLTDEEYDVIKKHEIIGVKILEPLKELQEVLPWIMYHHERWDGKGYPHGLAGEAIPVGAQIISLCDVFDALATGRDYKKAFSVPEATEEIKKSKGAQFNPKLADIFVDIISNPRP